MNYAFPTINNGQPIVNPTIKLFGFTGVEYIKGVSQDGFTSTILLIRPSDGKRFSFPLYNPLTRPTELTMVELWIWINIQLIQYEV